MEEDKDLKINFLEEKIKNLVKELQDTKIHLQKYTNPQRHKKYQEKNKEKIQEYAKEYSKKYYETKKLLNEF
jgi:adenine C2-methylase RlmN of 23S rRNA A2503 and tRNA A37